MFQSLGAKTFILPTPVFLVGTYDHTGRPNIMTAAWGGICASQPPSIAVSIRKSRWTYNAILERKSFTINIPSRKLAAQSDFAGMHSGRDTDKFTALNLTPVPAEHVDAPGIAECPVIVELTLSHTLELGSHTQFIGEIMDVKVDSACMREDGLPDPALIDPLLFAPLVQEYWAISQFEARAFSAGHALTHSPTPPPLILQRLFPLSNPPSAVFTMPKNHSPMTIPFQIQRWSSKNARIHERIRASSLSHPTELPPGGLPTSRKS